MKYKGIKKLYYSISEISDMLGIKQSVIRYWESEFKELKPQKNRAGNRIYKKDDIAILRLISHYVYGRHLSIHEANEVISDLKTDGLYKRKLQEVNSVEPTPLPMDDDTDDEIEEIEESFDEELEEVSDEDIDNDIDDEPEEDREDETDETVEEEVEEEIEEEQDDIVISSPADEPKEEPKSRFEIVTPTQETFIYPLDDLGKEEDEEKDTVESEDKLPEPVTEAGSRKPEVRSEKLEIIPEPVVEPVKQSDPELKELLRKISANIKDIIDILNE